MNWVCKNVLRRPQGWCQMQSSVKTILIKSVYHAQCKAALNCPSQDRGDGKVHLRDWDQESVKRGSTSWSFKSLFFALS